MDAPVYDQVIGSDYTVWDGTSEITAPNGQEILIVEIDGESRAKKAGIATIVVSGRVKYRN